MRVSWKPRALGLFVLAVFTALGLLATPVGGAGADRVLDGAIDIHVHCDPDSAKRSIDSIDVAKLALSRGMRGLVLKNHHEPTASQAYLVRKVVPGLEVFGAVTMDRAEGGINVAAVEQMAHVKGGWGRIVWMPTADAENDVRSQKENRPFVSVSRNGELLPEVKEVISVIAKNGLVLATGHCSAEEGLMLVREGRRQGVEHMVVTHAMEGPVWMNIAQMQEAAKLGAFIEFDSNLETYARLQQPRELLLHKNRDALIGEYVEAMRKVGPEFCIISEELTDHPGKDPSPEQHLDNITAFVAALGFSERDIGLMMKGNPARLLGLPPR